MKRKLFLLALIVAGWSYNCCAQNVGIGIATPQQKLHVAGSGQTIRVDGLSGAGTRNVYANAFGDLTTTPGSPSDVWLTSGNAGLNNGINFLGTTDNVDLRFRTNNLERVTIKANGRIGIWTNNPSTWLHVIPSTPILNWQLQWDNTLTDDAPARFQNTSAANPNRVLMGTTNYNSFGFQASAVIGIALNATNTYPNLAGGEGVRGYSNSYSGIGVYGGFTGGTLPTAIGWAVYASGWAGGLTSWLNVSDERLKTNITTIPNALGKVLQMRGVEYNFRQGEFTGLNLSSEKQVGFIAQELEKVLPSAVQNKAIPYDIDPITDGPTARKGSYNLKAVAYSDVIPVLVEAIKEQQKQIDDLKLKIEQLEKLKK
ncbi:MAG: tail fiber domain-containing protein [Bacteroidia bacterium]|nr:tail fiber domain-containing protein [Bacteroidia bacterium]MCZ2276996.1 tail fiber domain-containing protein [Bacteroidia bacterium]